jgi:chromosomal replication initiator protein
VTLSSQDFSTKPDIVGRDFADIIVNKLIARIGVDRFDLWFSNKDCVALEPSDKPQANHCVSIVADNAFSLQRIQGTFGKDIRFVVDQVVGPHYSIAYRLVETTTPEAIETEAQSTTGKSENETVDSNNLQSDGVEQNATLRFESPDKVAPSNQKPRLKGVRSFWFGGDNKLIEAGVDQLFERPGQFSPFFIYGPTGSGKSHLLESITTDFRRRLRMKRCVFLSAEQFTSEFVGSLRGGMGLPVFRRKYRDLDLLAIDDIQFLAGKRATLGEFQHTIDNLIRTGKQIIVTSDRPPIELGHLGSDISARLSGGLTCPLEYPDLEGRISIVRKMCADRNMNLPNSVVEMICEQLTRDVRRLSGAVNRLHAYSVSIGQAMTPELAQKVLCDLFSLSGPNCTSMVTIEQAVCEFCGVAPNELKSPSRQKRISSARMLAMYLSRQYTGSAFSEIGEYFGGRSHSTAIAAERKVAKWIEENEGIKLPHAVYPAKEVVRRIESNLRIG